jgi:hypothetical protein
MARISDRGTRTEVLSQLKDQYEQRERENETRHRDEIRELRETHRAELDRVRAEAQKRVVDTQEESNVKLNQKDLQHQKEIESIKSLYSKRLSDSKKV